MKNYLIRLSCVLLVTAAFLTWSSCNPDKEPEVKIESDVANPEVAMKWADMTLRAVYRLAGNSPTYCSRALGYLGLTMYESIVAGSATHQSIASQLNGLGTLPAPEAGKRYRWEIALNAGQAFMLKKMYPFMSSASKESVDSLANAIEKSIAASEDAEVVARSKAYGEKIASAIFDWSTTDGGHEGYLRNFPTDYVMPTGPGKWQPPRKSQSTSQRPLHPYWGSNRTFIRNNSLLPVPQIIPYSTNRFSQNYAQFLEIYAKSFNLTEEEKEIAAWWSDDPSEVYSPPGHSYNLATIAIRTAKPNLTVAAETYAHVGMAVADAFIECWKCKYTYYSERPSTFIRDNIDGSWVQYWPEPPFPAFTSGHATQGAATAVALTDIYGEPFFFIDDTHKDRERDTAQNVGFKPRAFYSFWETAEESAYSRFLGGIHTRQDNVNGMAQGRTVGYNVNRLIWKK